MKRILILQHVWDNHKGYVGQLLDDYAIPYDIIDVEHEIIPNAKRYAAVISLGGSQHIYAIDRYPCLIQERVRLHTIVKYDIPYHTKPGFPLWTSGLWTTVSYRNGR